MKNLLPTEHKDVFQAVKHLRNDEPLIKQLLNSLNLMALNDLHTVSKQEHQREKVFFLMSSH